MSDYAVKLAALSEKETKLAAEKIKLIEKRRSEIAELAEKSGLLLISNELLAGAFAEVSQLIQSKDARIKHWEETGEKFLNSKRSTTPPTTKETKRTTGASA